LAGTPPEVVERNARRKKVIQNSFVAYVVRRSMMEHRLGREGRTPGSRDQRLRGLAFAPETDFKFSESHFLHSTVTVL